MAFSITGSGFGTPAVTFAANHYHTAIEGAANDSAAVTVLGSGWSGNTGATGTRTTTTLPSGAPITSALISDKYVAGASTDFPFWYDFGATIDTAYFSWLCFFEHNAVVATNGSQWKAFRMTYASGSVEDRDAPSLYFRKTVQTGNWTEQFTVHQSSTANTPADATTTDQTLEEPGSAEFYCAEGSWHRVEFWFKQSSGIDVADGYLKLNITKLSDGSSNSYTATNANMYTTLLNAANQGRRYSSLLFQNYIGNNGYAGVVDVQVYLADIHLQKGTRGVVYLGNASTWAACTVKIPQYATTWTDTEITGEYHPAELTTENDNYLYVMLDDGSMYSTDGVAVGEPVLPSLSVVYGNLAVNQGAAVGVVDWGISHWTDADSVTITNLPATIDASDAEAITGNWPSTDRTYLVRAVASNAEGNSSPAYFTVQVGEGSAIAGGSTGSILGRVIR